MQQEGQALFVDDGAEAENLGRMQDCCAGGGGSGGGGAGGAKLGCGG